MMNTAPELVVTSNDRSLIQALAWVIGEMSHQEEKHGEKNSTLGMVDWHLVEAEEFGEVSKATYEWHFGKPEDAERDAAEMLNEWVDTAAVAVRAIVAAIHMWDDISEGSDLSCLAKYGLPLNADE